MAIRKKWVYVCAATFTSLLIVHTYLTIFKWLRNSPLNGHHDGDEASKKSVPSFLEQRKPAKSVICVLVLVCNRPSVKRCLDSVFRSRTLTRAPVDFPLIVSQDCGNHTETTKVLQSYGKKIHHIYQPNQEEISVKDGKNVGYYKQTRHISWALKQAFDTFLCPAVITLEDDLEVSPDFFEYFAATYPLLVNDTSLYCVTASNMQAMPGRVNASAHELLHRTDYFFGWGWMITKPAFRSLGSWPKVFWDTWMGLPNVRMGRSCIRPEIPRIKNFGRDGVSGHAFYDSLVHKLAVSDKFVPFTLLNLSYLEKENYRRYMLDQLQKSTEVKDLNKFSKNLDTNKFPPEATFRITYNTPASFKALTKKFRVYGETWNGIAHTVYNGVLTFIYKNRRIYLMPGKSWLGYTHFSKFDN